MVTITPDILHTTIIVWDAKHCYGFVLLISDCIIRLCGMYVLVKVSWQVCYIHYSTREWLRG